MNYLKYILFGLFICHYDTNYQNIMCRAESVMYLSTERPTVNWYDKKAFKNFSLISKRLKRQDPRYYVTLYANTLFNCGNNFKLDFYFYQFLTNRYQPSFVEMHFGFCDMLHSDTIFGLALRNALNGSCPVPPGEYNLQNMMIPYVPKGFPFPKGRIYCNASLVEDGQAKHVLQGSIDMEVKMRKIKNN